MRLGRMLSWAALGLVVLAACQPVPEGDPNNPFAQEEESFRAAYDAAPIALTGSVVTPSGEPVAGARVKLAATASGDSEIGTETATTGAEGLFRFEELSRHNRLVSITADGRRPAVAVARLVVPIDVERVELDPLVAGDRPEGTARLLFAGDVALGRRFVDPGGEARRDEVPPPDPEALISTGDPYAGSAEVFRHVAPLFKTVDYPIVNLESPVTDDPATPHESKDFVFFTLPGSLPALRDAGIRYVSLGNNHLYDYLEAGVADTLGHLDEVGLAHSGAGTDADAAYAPHREIVAGAELSLLSATSVAGEEHPPSLVATPDKGGAADLRDQERMRDAIRAELDADRVPIAQLHSGVEYAREPNTEPGNWFDAALDEGANVVIGHHPHVAQGVRAEGDDLVFYSLGNFAVDQNRQETMLGLTAVVDVRGGVPTAAYAIPVYLEDFRPRLIGGRLLAREIRRLGELSPSTTLYPFGGRGWIDLSGEGHAFEERVVTTEVSIGEEGYGVVDLRGIAGPKESLAKVEASSATGLRTGRDLMLHGDFEDFDADGQRLEAARWDHDPRSLKVCMRDPHRGAAALCSSRASYNSDDSVLAYRNRVRVLKDAEGTPNKDLTLLGYIKRQNAGPVAIVARYLASAGSETFGEEIAFQSEAGDEDWSMFAGDLAMPPDDPMRDPTDDHPRAIRLFFRHTPPDRGYAQVMYDDIAVVSWDPGELAVGEALPPVSSVEFLRVEGRPGAHELRLRLRRMRPAALD